MWRSPEPRYDVATGLAQGGRDYQEDAITTDFPFGMDSGIAVLADGMGGHEAGDVASKLVLTEVYSHLKFESVAFGESPANIPDHLKMSATRANEMIRDYVNDHPEARGMGSTLVSTILTENKLYWMSIGDSPLYVLRDGELRQLNEDHSLAPQIDYMVEQGLLDEESGRNHPDRNCLTSALMGSKVAKSDCPAEPFEMRLGDIILVSSDGLQYLGDEKLRKVLHKYRRRKSAEIAGHLLEAIYQLNDPDQDNVSFSVIKLNHMKPVERKLKRKPIGNAQASSDVNATRVVKLNTTPDAKQADAPKKPNAPKKKEDVPVAKQAGGR